MNRRLQIIDKTSLQDGWFWRKRTKGHIRDYHQPPWKTELIGDWYVNRDDLIGQLPKYFEKPPYEVKLKFLRRESNYPVYEVRC